MKDSPAYFPDFFIAGAPKCGTTSLYRWLVQCPRVSIPVKEMNWFCPDIFRSKGATYAKYLKCYQSTGCDPQETLFGDATPKYLYSKKGIQEIERINPQAKYIVCVRDVVSLVVSMHSQMVREGIESEVDFEAAWQRSPASNICQVHGVRHRMLDYRMWSKLGTRVARLVDLVGAERVLVLQQSEMKERPRDVFEKALGFLGLPLGTDVEFTIANERAAMRSPLLHRSLVRMRRVLLPPSVADGRHRWWKGTGILRLISMANSRRGRYQSELSDAFHERLASELREEQLVLDELLDLHRDKWSLVVR